LEALLRRESIPAHTRMYESNQTLEVAKARKVMIPGGEMRARGGREWCVRGGRVWCVRGGSVVCECECDSHLTRSYKRRPNMSP
jgi:hypothetical protein